MKLDFFMKKVKLIPIGLSYSRTSSGAYALIMTEENGQRRLPVVIGANEAQAIAIQMEGMKPYRPLTHDLFLYMASAFSIEVIEVNIIKLKDGIFYSEIVCKRKKKEIKIDARTSDAIAISMKFDCPIYVNEKIMKKAAILLDEKSGSILHTTEQDKEEEEEKKEREISDYSNDELNEMMIDVIKEEDYETASIIRDEIKKRNVKK